MYDRFKKTPQDDDYMFNKKKSSGGKGLNIFAKKDNPNQEMMEKHM